MLRQLLVLLLLLVLVLLLTPMQQLQCMLLSCAAVVPQLLWCWCCG